MAIHTLLLYLFGTIALISASMVILSKNPIHSVIFLILVFCNTAGLLTLLKIEFLAMMFLIIYVGAIAVLFLFVVMMLNIKMNSVNATQWARYLPIGGVISAIFLLELLLIFFGWPRGRLYETLAEGLDMTNGLQTTYSLCLDPVGPMTCGNVQKRWTALIDPASNIQTLGMVIYTYYFYYFLMSSLILLVAMIGAIVLTMHKRRFAAKKQLIFRQVARNFEEAIGYADVASSRRPRA